MQFFPNFTSSSVSALGGVSLSTGGPAHGAKANDFLDSLNRELSAAGVSPIVDVSLTPGTPKGFRTIKRDVSAKLDDEDVSLVLDKLRKRGVKESSLTGIEGLLAADTSPTIGSLMGVIRNQGRVTDELSDDELKDIATALQKMQFSKDEADGIMELMENGNGFEAMRLIKARAAELGEGTLSLNKGEVRAVMRGLDISENAMQKVAALFGGDESREVDAKALEALLGPASEELANKRSENEKLAAEFKGVIDEALREKKVRERNELVADMRGNRLTDRAERRMRDDLTAKANGFGEKSAKELEEEESSLADEEMARQQQQNARQKTAPDDRRTVSVPESALGKSAEGADKKASQAKQSFASITNRVEVATGMTPPVQGQNVVPRENAAASFAQRQEIFSQVEQGMLRQLADGSRQMTLQLNPQELGQLTLILSVKGGEVKALIRAETPEATAALSDQMNQLRASLEEQGLKVAQLDVETQLPQDTTQQQQWSDTAQFNQEQEMREQARFHRLARIRREAGATLAQNVQNRGMEAEISASGLHLIA